jgi:hypothetical protein
MASLALRGKGISEDDQHILDQERQRKQQSFREEADTYERNRPAPEGLFTPYILVGDAAHRFVHGNTFTVLVNLAVCITCVYVAMLTYPAMRGDPSLVVLDKVMSSVFVLEVVLKVVGETTRPWMYFCE